MKNCFLPILLLFLLSCRSQITENNTKKPIEQDTLAPIFVNGTVGADSVNIFVYDKKGLQSIQWQAISATDSTKFRISYNPLILPCASDTITHRITIKHLDTIFEGFYHFTFEDCAGNKSNDTIHISAHALQKEFSNMFFTLTSVTEFFNANYSNGQQKSFTQNGDYVDSASSGEKIAYGYVDTIIFSYSVNVSTGAYPSITNHTIKLIVDWPKRMIPFFQYETHTSFYGHYSGTWDESILIKDFPYVINSDGSISSYLLKDTLQNSIYSFSHNYSGASDIDGVSVTENMNSFSLDSLRSHFQFILK